jgi:uncharacterized protein (DUF58 family)
LLTSAAYVTGGLVGAAVAGALGSAWGVALATLFGAAVWWWQLRAGLRELDAVPPTTSRGAPVNAVNHEQMRIS